MRHILQKAQIRNVHVADVEPLEIGAVFPAVNIVVREIDLVVAPCRGDEIFRIRAEIIVAEVHLPDDTDAFVFLVERVKLLIGEVRVTHLDLCELRKLGKGRLQRGNVCDGIVVEIEKLNVPFDLLPLNGNRPPGGDVRVLLDEREPVRNRSGAPGQVDRTEIRKKIERSGELRERRAVLAAHGQFKRRV